MSLPSYLEYKDSGVEWLGRVPSHWEACKFRHAFTESAEKIESEVVGVMLSVSGYRGIEIKEYDDDNRRRLDEDLIGYRIVRPGQLVVNTMWLNYAGLGVSEHEGHVSPAYRSYWIAPSFNKRYVHHMMRCDSFVRGYTKFLTGIRPNSLQMSRDDLMAFMLLNPPIEEQTAIATFLDRETAKIDALIAEQEKLLTLLAEKRQATISHAVTKGLNPDAPMKDSGVTWLGEVPAHWGLKPMRHICQVNPPVSFDGIGEDAELTFLPMDRIKGGYYLPNLAPLAQCNSSYSTFDSGDILLAKVTPCFENGNIAIAGAKGFGTSELFVIRAKYIESRLLYWYLQSAYFKMDGEASMTGAGGLKRVSTNVLSRHLVPIPSPEEQAAIVVFLDTETTKLDALKEESEHAIDLLKERRTALISAAVTGKIDVRETVEC